MEINTKQRIFDNAVLLFSEKSYDRVSVKEIGNAAGISEPAVYRHFKNKEAILTEILAVFSSKLKGYILTQSQVDRYIETDTPRQLLERCIGRFTEEDTPFMAHTYRIVFQEAMNKKAASELVTAQLHYATAESIKYVLDRLIERGSIPVIDTWFYSMLWAQSMFSGAAVWVTCFFQGKAIETSAEEYNKMAQRLVDMALSGKVPCG